MEQMSRKKQNNAGMSLVEMIVVVLIIGILSAGAVVGFSFIRSMDASSAAEEVVSLLERTRLNTLSAEEGAGVRLEIKKDGKNYYGTIFKDGTEIEKTTLGGNGLTLDVSGFGEVGSTPVVFSFYKSNGAYQSTYDKIEITGAKTSVVYLVTATGRTYIEN